MELFRQVYHMRVNIKNPLQTFTKTVILVMLSTQKMTGRKGVCIQWIKSIISENSSTRKGKI